MLYCQALCFYIIEPSTSCTRRQFRPFGPSINGRARDFDPKPETRHRVSTAADISKTILRYLDRAFHPLTLGQTARIVLDLMTRSLLRGEWKWADERSINGEMGICEIIENLISFFFFFEILADTRSIIFL